MPHDSDSPSIAPLSKALLILLLVVGAASIPVGAWYAYEYSSIAKGSGGYQLRVHIASKRQVRSIRTFASFQRDEAQWVADHRDIDPRKSELPGKVEAFGGFPIEVPIYTWSNTTRSGHISGGQNEWLTVVAEFDDGTRQAKVIAIPDMRLSREVRVEFPWPA